MFFIMHLPHENDKVKGEEESEFYQIHFILGTLLAGVDNDDCNLDVY